MTTYVQIDGVLYEKGTEPAPVGHMVMPEIKPYKSMITGEMITSRAQHRAHLKRHGCVEVGNETAAQLKYYERAKADVERRQKQSRLEVIKAQVNRMTNKEFARAVDSAITHWKWNSREG